MLHKTISKPVKRAGCDRNFTKLYNVVIDRVWGYLTPTEQAVYVVMLRYADYHHRCTWVSQGLIGREVRRLKPVRKEHVSRAIAGLATWGLVVKRYTKRGLCYQLSREAEIVGYLAKMEVLPRGLEGARECEPPPQIEPELEQGVDWDAMPSTLAEVQAAEGRGSR